MPLITVNLPEHVSNSILCLLERLVVAVERIAGPVIQYRPPIPATLRDYAYVSPEEADRVRQSEEDFASRHMVVPGSPAYVAAIEEFERMVGETYGEEAIGKLPWKVLTRDVPNVDSTPR